MPPQPPAPRSALRRALTLLLVVLAAAAVTGAARVVADAAGPVRTEAAVVTGASPLTVTLGDRQVRVDGLDGVGPGDTVAVDVAVLTEDVVRVRGAGSQVTVRGSGVQVLVALGALVVGVGAGLGARRLRGAAGLETAAALLLGVGLVVVWP